VATHFAAAAEVPDTEPCANWQVNWCHEQVDSDNDGASEVSQLRQNLRIERARANRLRIERDQALKTRAKLNRELSLALCHEISWLQKQVATAGTLQSRNTTARLALRDKLDKAM
jgi:hypothetical protein